MAGVERMREETNDPLKLTTIDALIVLLRSQFESQPDVLRAKEILAGIVSPQNDELNGDSIKQRLTKHNAIRDLYKDLRR
jgi:hypothetical protein